MKTLKNILTAVAVAAALASGINISNAQTAADPTGILTLAGPGGRLGLDWERPIVLRIAQTTTKDSLSGLPSSIAPATFTAFTNAIFPVPRGSDVTFTLTFGSLPTNSAATSNLVLYVDLTPDGRIWASNSPLTLAYAQVGSNQVVTKTVIIGETNFGQNAYFRVRGGSNTMTTGAGSMFPSNLVISAWRPKPLHN